MQVKSQKTLYTVLVNTPSGKPKEVLVCATSQEVAEARALKRTPNATGIYRGA